MFLKDINLKVSQLTTTGQTNEVAGILTQANLSAEVLLTILNTHTMPLQTENESEPPAPETGVPAADILTPPKLVEQSSRLIK